MSLVIVIIYNASGTIMGEIKYILSCAISSKNHCSACDLTHSFKEMGEKKEFQELKKRIKVPIVQLHTNELNSVILSYLESKQLELPIVLLAKESDLEKTLDSPAIKQSHDKEQIRTIFTSEELANLNLSRNPISEFEERLKTKLNALI